MKGYPPHQATSGAPLSKNVGTFVLMSKATSSSGPNARKNASNSKSQPLRLCQEKTERKLKRRRQRLGDAAHPDHPGLLALVLWIRLGHKQVLDGKKQDQPQPEAEVEARRPYFIPLKPNFIISWNRFCAWVRSPQFWSYAHPRFLGQVHPPSHQLSNPQIWSSVGA